MTRRIYINASDAIGTWIGKNNQLAQAIGDLDSLDSGFSGIHTGYLRSDSDIVSALNMLHLQMDSINDYIFDSLGVLRLQAVYADSADIGILHAEHAAIDSAQIDSAHINKLTGSYMRFDSADIDSARIRHLSGESLFYDSGRFKNLAVIDSAFIDNVAINEANVERITVRNDAVTLSHAQLFTVQDSVGTTLLAGYLLSTDSAANTA
jgi:hypothetical protein